MRLSINVHRCLPNYYRFYYSRAVPALKAQIATANIPFNNGNRRWTGINVSNLLMRLRRWESLQLLKVNLRLKSSGNLIESGGRHKSKCEKLNFNNLCFCFAKKEKFEICEALSELLTRMLFMIVEDVAQQMLIRFDLHVADSFFSACFPLPSWRITFTFI